MSIHLPLRQLTVLIAFIATACGSQQNAPQPQVVLDKSYTTNEEGVVEYIWEAPMVDVVEIPPGLDPEGIYYRPGHQEVVEIRQGKWKYYKKGQEQEQEQK